MGMPMSRERAVSRAFRKIVGVSALLLTVAGRAADADTGNWTRYGLDGDETRHSPLSQINAQNVSQLGLAWSVELQNEPGVLEGTPLEIDGVLYVNGGVGAIYAFDAVTGRALWSYDPHAHEANPRGTRRMYSSDRGLAYWNGRIYTCTKDGRMVALDAKSGQVVWTTQFLIPGVSAVSTGAPRALDGTIIIGTSGSEFAGRGYVTAVDAETGKVVWRFYTVPGNPSKGFEDPAQEMAAKTWSGEWWKYGGGGAPWNAITYDEELGQVYIGTGNAGPWADKVRAHPGDDNLFSASIVALDVKTGKYLWHYQATPDDVWDYDATADIVLANLKIDGALRKVLLQANKNGFFYVIDRVNGKLLSAGPYAPVTWASKIDLKTGRPIEIPGSRYPDKRTTIAPSMVGAHDWQAMSYNPKTGLAYIPVIRGVEVMAPSKEAMDLLKRNAGRIFSDQGVDGVFRPEKRDGAQGGGRDELVAWDPVAQKAVWRTRQPCQFNGGTLNTDGNLVFQGRTDGQFVAYTADKGDRLWSFNAHMGILAPPITYTVQDQQYISVLAGYGGGAGESAVSGYGGWSWGMPRRLLTFRIGGTAQLPSPPEPVTHVTPLDDPSLRLNAKRVAAGNNLYGEICTGCHGEAVVGNGNAPDLRASGTALDRDAFRKVLKEGLFVPFGMPKFDDLSDGEIAGIYEFIRSRAREDLKSGRDGADAVMATDPQ